MKHVRSKPLSAHTTVAVCYPDGGCTLFDTQNLLSHMHCNELIKTFQATSTYNAQWIVQCSNVKCCCDQTALRKSQLSGLNQSSCQEPSLSNQIQPVETWQRQRHDLCVCLAVEFITYILTSIVYVLSHPEKPHRHLQTWTPEDVSGSGDVLSSDLIFTSSSMSSVALLFHPEIFVFFPFSFFASVACHKRLHHTPLLTVNPGSLLSFHCTIKLSAEILQGCCRKPRGSHSDICILRSVVLVWQQLRSEGKYLKNVTDFILILLCT